MHFISTLLLCLIMNIKGEEEAIQSVEIGTDGAVKQETTKHPNSLEVIFENQSGQPVELYWDDSKEGVLQSSLDHTNQITINTFLGHKFYYTPKDSNGSKTTILYEVIMEEHIGLITLYHPATMKERDVEFERKKSKWMKEYVQKTGRRWLNYYPREPVTHHYYDVQETGEKIFVKTDRTQFHICAEDDLSQQDIAKLNEMESEWLHDEKNTAVSDKCKEDPDADACKKIPPSFQIDNDNFYIGRMNDTTYCRRKIAEGVENITIEITNLCAYSPRAFRIYNFLSDAEMEHVKTVGQYIGLKRSTVSEEALTTLDRTSQTVWLERSKSFIIDNIVRRVANTVNISESLLYLNGSSESLQLVHYFGGELYKSHVDYGTDRPHNRYITFLMYLNDVTDGGNTSFSKPDAECKDHNNYFGVRPVKGSVMFFYDLFPDGNVDAKSQHYAEPPVDSEKWMTNLWIWDKVFTR